MIKKIEKNTIYRIIAIIVTVFSFIILFNTCPKDEKVVHEEYHVSSSNQKGGITAGKIIINDFDRPDSISYKQNYYYKYHSVHTYKDKGVIEVRPKQRTWYPFVVGIPISEKNEVELDLIYGPANKPPRASMTHTIKTKSDDGKWYVIISEQQASPNQSFYITFKKEPSLIVFGPQHEEKKYMLDLSKMKRN